jgi:hypothetical protein
MRTLDGSAVVLIALIALLSCAHRAGATATVYLATTGSDASASCSATAPCATLQRALVTIGSGGGTISVAPGTYTGTGNVALNIVASNISIVAEADGVVFSGGGVSVGWMMSGSNVVFSGLHLRDFANSTNSRWRLLRYAFGVHFSTG